MDSTIANAAILNENSCFGDGDTEQCSFLAVGDETSRTATPNFLDDGVSQYYYFPFGGENRITQIVILTAEYNVFGIRVGDKASSADGILKDEGYSRRKTNNNAPSSNTTYTKDYISITISGDINGDLISQIVIDAMDPKQNGIDY